MNNRLVKEDENFEYYAATCETKSEVQSIKNQKRTKIMELSNIGPSHQDFIGAGKDYILVIYKVRKK